jgi:uncharacterized membrane protein YkoI
MKEFISKLKEKLTKNNKKAARIAAIVVAAVFVITVTVFSIIYFRAKSNIKYSQDQLEKIALTKVKGEVVGVNRELNFKKDSFDYDFKIKTPNNVLRDVKMDSEYGVILNSKGNIKKQTKKNNTNKVRKNNKNKQSKNEDNKNEDNNSNQE